MLEKFEGEGWVRVTLYTLLGIGASVIIPFVVLIVTALLFDIFLPLSYSMTLMVNIAIGFVIFGIICSPFFVLSTEDFRFFGPLGSFLSILWISIPYSFSGSGDYFFLFAFLLFIMEMIWIITRCIISLILIIIIPSITSAYYLYTAPIRFLRA